MSHYVGLGDITFVAIAAGFVYVAIIMDAWSRRVVGWRVIRNRCRPPSSLERWISSETAENARGVTLAVRVFFG